MAKSKRTGHRRTANVDEAVLHAYILGRLDEFIRLERHGVRTVQDNQVVAQYFDSPGRQLGVLATVTTRANHTGYRDNPLVAKGLSQLVAGDFLRIIRVARQVKDNLRNALAVAQVHKKNPAVIAVAPYPSTKANVLATVFVSKLTAVVSPLEYFVAERFHRSFSARNSRL